MGRWEKHYTNGEVYIGDDNNPETTWRGSSLTGIYKVNLYCAPIQGGNTKLEISGIGEYWQSDDYELNIFQSKGSKSRRRIERKISNYDRFYTVIYSNNTVKVEFLSTIAKYTDRLRTVTPDLIDKWFILEICIKTGDIKTYFSNDKI